jgi:hypothetical protein
MDKEKPEFLQAHLEDSVFSSSELITTEISASLAHLTLYRSQVPPYNPSISIPEKQEAAVAGNCDQHNNKQLCSHCESHSAPQ